MKTIITTLAILFTFQFAYSQGDSVSLKRSPAQITLFYPIGTHGNSQSYVNNFSINIFSGINGGLDGVEFGGIYNQTNQRMNGVQFAGILNNNLGTTQGVQFGGMMNMVKNMKGAQFAGCVNLAKDMQGPQIAGLYNASENDNGSQIAGFMNLSRTGKGAQISGFMNLSDTITGSQITGFLNAANQSGPQISGFMNMANNIKGCQISGFMNMAGKMQGFQIAGLMNICDSLNGISLAPISIIRNGGYYAIDLSVNESFFTNLSFLMGTRKLYSIYELGVQTIHSRYLLGFGFGTSTMLNAKSYLDIQATTAHISEDYEAPFKYTNLLNQLKFNYELEMSKNMVFYAGPSLNVLVSSYRGDNRKIIGSDFMPFKAMEYSSKRTIVSLWPGLQIGLKKTL